VSASAIAVIVGTLRRRSERRVEEQRRESERMAALEQVKSHFLNVASHELRGPLSIARGYASMLADGTFGPLEASDIRRAVPILMSKLEEMNALVDSMLDTARLEERRLVLRLSPVDVRILIDRAMVSVQPSLSPKHELTWRRPPRPVMVMADEARLSIIITNVLHNAVKYSPDGGGIDCFLSVDRGEMLLTVWDHGLGIAEKDLPRLFTRFGRIVTRENSHILGTGLGLYLARELALLHGGDLKVASSYGHGSAFTLIMPLLSDADMADATDAAASGESPARSRAPRAKRRTAARV
jgi:signal transduction histidine kinase